MLIFGYRSTGRKIRLVTTKDGSHTLFNEKIGDSYHSRHGAVQESRYVFLEQGLEKIAEFQSDIHILELGFGTGLNAALTWMFALDHPQLSLHYSGMEKFPLSVTEAGQLNYNQYLTEDFTVLHTKEWNTDHSLTANFTFKKVKSDFDQLNTTEAFDLVYFDVFGPVYQPEYWQEPFLSKVAQSLKVSGMLVTYCAQGAFQRALKELDFVVENLPGPPGKREMVRAWKHSIPDGPVQ